MLKKLRHKKMAKWIWVTLIVAAFILFGSGTFIRSREETAALGKIFGRKVTLLEYRDAFEATKNQLIIQFGDKLSEIQKQINLESQTWDRLILLAEAKRRKLKASDREVIELIENYPFFRNREGKFDNRIYDEMLRYVFRTQPRVFEEQTRQNLMLSKLFDLITKAVTVSDQETREEYRKLNEEISIYYIASNPYDFAKNLTPSEQDLKDYFAKHSLDFKQPPSFNLEYIALPKDERDEKTTEDKIKKIFARLYKKEGLAKVAKDFNLEAKETGFFTQSSPTIPGIGDSPQILNLIPKLKIGQFLPPVNMDKYYYILRLKELKGSYVPDFQAIKDRAKAMFVQNKSRETAKEKIENCLKKLKEISKSSPQALDFNKIAQEFGLKSDSTEPFRYGNYLKGIGGSGNLWRAARELKADEFSEIIDLPSGFYIVKVKSRKPIDEKKFEQEKADFSQQVLLLKKQEYFENFFEGLKRKVEIF